MMMEIRVAFSKHERLDKILSRVADQGRASDGDVRELIEALGAAQPRPSKKVMAEIIYSSNGQTVLAAGRVAAHTVQCLANHLVNNCEHNTDVWHTEMVKWITGFLSDED
jgi:hypothetical protein